MDNTNNPRLRRPGNPENDTDNDNHNNDNNNRALQVSNSNRFSWQHSSRIVRVSRATGGKDRHSKVLTSKGLRDRRVRLSVSTAIQFYDLQDRLGYDQPSKAVEWLIKAAEDAIAELPSLDTKFSESMREAGGSDERVGFDVDLENDGSFQQHKSGCSSTSETSKGSVLSLSRSESRVKARERARERTAKDKDKEPQIDECECAHQHNSQNPSFTELLNSGGGGGGGASNSPNQSATQSHNSTAFFLKQTRQSPPPMSMDYFSTNLFGQASSTRNQFSSGFSSQPHFGIAPPANTMTMQQFTVTNDPHPQHPQHHHPELQQFSFLPDHLIPESQTSGDYNLNFSISSGLAGYNRGTLQSNSPSTLPPHFQRFTTSPPDGSSIPFYIGNSTASNAASTEEDNQFPTGFNGRLQLYYGDGSRHSDTKGKEKS